MKIAIYDKWLNALGGGEKVATVMAEVLSKDGHKVDLISNFDVNKKQLESKMAVDLSKVYLKTWYERSYEKLLPKTKNYDVFINVSFLDHLPSAAAHSIYYIHFPTPLKTTLLGFIKYDKILPFLRKFLIIPEVAGGLYPIDDVYTRGGRWLSKENAIVFSNTPKRFELKIRVYAEQLSLSTLNKVSFESPNSKIRLVDKFIDHDFNVLVYRLNVHTVNQHPAIKILSQEDIKVNALGLVSMTIKNYRFFLWNIIKRYMPRYEMALYGSSGFKVAEGLDTYGKLLSNSNFTSRWTKKYWDRDSTVLYPPVDVQKFKPGKKKNIILNVGRFFVGGHSKRQDVLVSGFKKLVDKKLIDGSWELHLVGGVAGGKDHTDYLNQIKDSAKGYPIYFHLFANFKLLKKLYSEAKIYWHATGFGVDQNHEPIKFEHFGITVVEAMSAGCVPIVFNGGGLVETVDHNCGLLWESESELIKKTSMLSKNNSQVSKMSKEAVLRSKEFSRQIFADHLLRAIYQLTK